MRADGPSPGARAVAVVDLRPDGVVRLAGEEWSATTDGPPLPAGAAVRVVERRGLWLHVRRVASRSPATDRINLILRQKLDEVTERWGVKVTTVEIRDVLPPHNVQDAMNRQLSAERNRRATVTESDGKREAAILVAEGEKQSAILRAEGERQSAILAAEGRALALEAVSKVARGLDGQTLGLQYLDALRSVGASEATKIVLPVELLEMLRPMMDVAARAVQPNGTSPGPSTPHSPRTAA